jgi:predicted permease
MTPALVLVFVALAGGYLARRLERFADNASDVLNRFVIDLCVPAVILRLIPTLSMRWDLATLIVTPWLLTLLSFIVTHLLSRMLAFDRGTTTVLFLCAAISNTSFLGFPLCAALLGESAVPLAAVYDQLGSFLLLCTVVPIVVAHAAGGDAPKLRDVARNVAVFPPFIALVIALIPWPHPVWLDQVLQQLAAALVPVAMFAVGLRLRITPPRAAKSFAIGLLLKLAIMPLLAWTIGKALGAAHDVLAVSVLEAAMPTSVTAGALLMAAGIAPELTAALVGWGIIAAQVSVPGWAWLLR